MSKKKVRPLGEILLDMEPFIQEAMDGHDLQWSDWLHINLGYLNTHYPNHIETYTADNKNPVLYFEVINGRPYLFYGPKENLKVSDES